MRTSAAGHEGFASRIDGRHSIHKEMVDVESGNDWRRCKGPHAVLAANQIKRPFAEPVLRLGRAVGLQLNPAGFRSFQPERDPAIGMDARVIGATYVCGRRPRVIPALCPG